MRVPAIVSYCVACLLQLLALVWGEDTGQWFQQRVQVLVKSLQVQQRHWASSRRSPPPPPPPPPSDGEGPSAAPRRTLAGRLRQYARRLKRLFSTAALTPDAAMMVHKGGMVQQEPRRASGAEEQASGPWTRTAEPQLALPSNGDDVGFETEEAPASAEPKESVDSLSGRMECEESGRFHEIQQAGEVKSSLESKEAVRGGESAGIEEAVRELSEVVPGLQEVVKSKHSTVIKDFESGLVGSVESETPAVEQAVVQVEFVLAIKEAVCGSESVVSPEPCTDIEDAVLEFAGSVGSDGFSEGSAGIHQIMQVEGAVQVKLSPEIRRDLHGEESVTFFENSARMQQTGGVEEAVQVKLSHGIKEAVHGEESVAGMKVEESVQGKKSVVGIQQTLKVEEAVQGEESVARIQQTLNVEEAVHDEESVAGIQQTMEVEEAVHGEESVAGIQQTIEVDEAVHGEECVAGIQQTMDLEEAVHGEERVAGMKVEEAVHGMESVAGIQQTMKVEEAVQGEECVASIQQTVKVEEAVHSEESVAGMEVEEAMNGEESVAEMKVEEAVHSEESVAGMEVEEAVSGEESVAEMKVVEAVHGKESDAGMKVVEAVPCIVLQHADQDLCTELETLQPPSRSKLQLKLHPAAANGGGVPSSRKSPVTVQEWVDSLPAPLHRSEDEGEEPPLDDADDVLDLGLGAEAGLLYDVGCPAVTIISPQPPPHAALGEELKAVRRDGLAREQSVQSDVTSHGSHGSSVESYLESRKPDPEEVLMSLGFGGPGSSLDSEVSRIPRRFLQPSKVKGVAIKDFLRYQQDLIETFETGFCGYHGLTGSSHSIPSTIVAKIMEKLREHERESNTSAATSDQADQASTPASPPPVARQRFSSVARRVLKRTSVLGAIPLAKQSLSVLNADNRRFLESQGSKSPEVPRKRMIIGHHSYTFGCDGEMIEVEASIPTPPPPPPKPLVHKDSVLSSVTSLSLTSVDSDSDTDDRSDSYELQRRSRLTTTPATSLEKGPHSSTPYSSARSPAISLSKIPPAMSLDLGAERIRTVAKLIHSHSTIGKRMSSTSLSSWESDALSPDSPASRPRFPTCEVELGDEYNVKPLKPPAQFYQSSSSPDSPLGARPIRYESIDEDVEVRTESKELVENRDCTDPPPEHCSECVNSVKQEQDDSVFVSPVTKPSLSRVPSINEAVVTTAHGRRGSLKRQQHITEDDATDILSTVASTSLPEQQPAEPTHLQVAVEAAGDSFEMEEIGIFEDEGRLATLSRARSDSSGFLEGDPGEHSPSDNSAARREERAKRLSLPVVRVHDERGSVLFSRSCSLHSLDSSCSSGSSGGERPRRRSRSAPNTLSLGGSCSSVSNMFSSCSDESVIHIGARSTCSRDLQELLDELAGRGVDLVAGPDSPSSLACQPHSQQADAVRLALGAYGSQLVGGTSSLELLESGPPEARRELQAVRDIRGQIAAELRRVAALLEEQPGPRAVAITRQMTALLREQTRLCRQLETLSRDAGNSVLRPEPAPCCNSEQLLGAVREENRRLERLVQGHSHELAEIRQLLRELVARHK